MSEFVQLIWSTLQRIDLRALADIVIVAAIIYWVLLLLRGTTAMVVLRGIVSLLLLGFFLGNLLQLTVVAWLFRTAFTAILVIVPILFLPELRRALERVGRTGFGRLTHHHDLGEAVGIVADASLRLASRRCGGLIVLERDTQLHEYVELGVSLDALATVDLLVSLFLPNGPLHDGAVILRGTKIVAARCVLPLSDSLGAGAYLGTRHRAALGLSERADAAIVVVSEERGTISVANDGHIAVQPDAETLRYTLAVLCGTIRASPPVRFGWRHAG